ncbi:hypothetical protein KC356_g273 [Hortaea werneckii]|nr:hypothetical protein KC356_g273 [Hortaea werneckii]
MPESSSDSSASTGESQPEHSSSLRRRSSSGSPTPPIALTSLRSRKSIRCSPGRRAPVSLPLKGCPAVNMFEGVPINLGKADTQFGYGEACLRLGQSSTCG